MTALKFCCEKSSKYPTTRQLSDRSCQNGAVSLQRRIKHIEFHRSKRLFKHICAEVFVFGGQISFENDIRINLWGKHLVYRLVF